jgi:hypothetical protein
MIERTRIWAWFVVGALLLTPLAGCAGDDGPDGDRAKKAVKAEKPVDGSFVGEALGTNVFVAVVAAAAEGEQDRRGVQVYVSDGKRLSEWFSGSIRDNSFVAQSADGSTEAKGKLRDDSVTGTVEVPAGKALPYVARRPAGAAGLYDLTVSSEGKLRGASAAGLGVTGEITLGRRGTGMLKLADGERLKFDVARNRAGDLIRLGAGQVRLIVLPGGEVRGAGKSRSTGDGGDSDFFVRSA